MKVVLLGTNHSDKEQEIEVAVEFMEDDVWTFTIPNVEFTISDLTPVMDFLEEMSKKYK